MTHQLAGPAAEARITPQRSNAPSQKLATVEFDAKDLRRDLVKEMEGLIERLARLDPKEVEDDRLGTPSDQERRCGGSRHRGPAGRLCVCVDAS